MKIDARFVFAQLGPLTGLSEDWFQRLAGVLVQDDRFISQRRRELHASDLASLLNTVMGGQTSQALEIDTMLQGLVYKGSTPESQAPIFPTRTWGAASVHMIQHAPSAVEHPAEPATDDIAPNTLPHQIEVAISTPYVCLVWLGVDGKPTRRDWYGPAKPAESSVILVRKATIDGRIISVLADILRAAAAGSSAGTQEVQHETAAPRKAAASLSRSRVKTTPPSVDTRGDTGNSDCRQDRTTRAPEKHRKIRSDRERLDPLTGLGA
jgi:hypothetical protein